jgi:hypothetical protein
MITVTDKHGNEIELDDDEPLPDGAHVSVRLPFMDAHERTAAAALADALEVSKRVQRAQAFVAQREQALADRQALFDTHRAGSRPGTKEQRDARYTAYCERITRDCAAWKTGGTAPADHVADKRKPRHDDVTHDVTDKSATDANTRRRASWLAHCQELTERWKQA